MAFPYSELTVTIKAYLGADPTAASGTWPAATDLSSRLTDNPITITQGRQRGQDTLSSGSCTFELTNTDGALTPLNPASAYFSTWDLGAPMSVDVDGVGASPPYGIYRGYIAAIEPIYSPGVGGADWSTVRVTLGGVVRRLGRGSAPRSSLRAKIAGADNIQAFWPLDEGRTSSVGALAAGTGSTMAPTGSVTFGAGDLGAWQPGGASLGAGTLHSTFAPTTAGSITVLAMLWAGGQDGTTTVDLRNAATGLTGDRWTITANGSTSQVTLDYYRDGVLTATGTASDGGLTDGNVHYLRLDITSILNISGVLTIDSSVTALASVAGTHRSLAEFTATYVPATTDTVAIGMVAVFAGTISGADYTSAAQGYTGEMAHDRIARVATEQAIPGNTAATVSLTCGPQATADVMSTFRDAETVDRGILTELTDDWGIGYISSAERANRAAAMTINLSTYRTSKGTSGGVLTPLRDDQRLRNEWTVDRPEGSSSTYADTEHQAKRGLYDDATTVNVYTDDMLTHQASWRVHEGTYDRLRFRTMQIDLGANAADAPTNLLSAWLATSIGDRIDRTNHPSGYADERMVLHGYTQRLTRKSWQVDAVVEPYDIWALKVYSPDATYAGRWAGDNPAAIRSALTTGTTSVPFDPNTFRWGTSAPTLTAKLLPSTAAKTSGGETVSITSLATTAATFVAAGTAAHGSNAAVVPGNYAGGAADDWVVVVGAVRTTTATLAITDANYTYTQLAHENGIYVWAAVRTSATPAPTVTPSGGVANMTVSAQVFGFRGMPITLDLDDYVLDLASQTNASAQNIDYGSAADGLTPMHIPGRLVLLVGRKADDWTSVAVPTSFTEDSETSSTVGDDMGLYVAHWIQTTPTAVPGGSLVVTGGAGAVSSSLLIAIAAGYQTATVTRAAGGTAAKAHSAGTRLAVDEALIWSL